MRPCFQRMGDSMVPFTPKSTMKFPGILGRARVLGVVCAWAELAIKTRMNKAKALTVMCRGIGFVAISARKRLFAVIDCKNRVKNKFFAVWGKL